MEGNHGDFLIAVPPSKAFDSSFVGFCCLYVGLSLTQSVTHPLQKQGPGPSSP